MKRTIINMTIMMITTMTIKMLMAEVEIRTMARSFDCFYEVMVNFT